MVNNKSFATWQLTLRQVIYKWLCLAGCAHYDLLGADPIHKMIEVVGYQVNNGYWKRATSRALSCPGLWTTQSITSRKVLTNILFLLGEFQVTTRRLLEH
jgi:hypothetical protein